MGSSLTLFTRRPEGKETQKSSASSSCDAKESSAQATTTTTTLPAAFTSGDPPMSFAIMRTAHEAFRAAMKEAGELLDGPPENKPAFIKIWRELQLCISAHKDMEELDVFPMLDAVKPGCVIDANISSLHVADDINVHDINQLIMRPDMNWDELRTAYNDWKDFHENHLCKEEEIMKETVSKIAPTAAARCLVVHDKMINTALLRSREELEALVSFCVSKMNRFGSQKMSPKEEVILFVRGLRGVSNKDQWEEFMPLCKKNCKAEIWEEMVNKYNIEEAEDGHLHH